LQKHYWPKGHSWERCWRLWWE